MAAYRRVDNLIIITCGLTACIPGSARGPALGNEYGNVLSFILYTNTNMSVLLTVGPKCTLAASHATLR